MSWYNVELTQEEAVKFRLYLMATGIRYETSGAFDLVHFEVLVPDSMLRELNDFLEVL